LLIENLSPMVFNQQSTIKNQQLFRAREEVRGRRPFLGDPANRPYLQPLAH